MYKSYNFSVLDLIGRQVQINSILFVQTKVTIVIPSMDLKDRGPSSQCEAQSAFLGLFVVVEDITCYPWYNYNITFPLVTNRC